MNKPSADRDAMTTSSQIFPDAMRQSDVQIGPLEQLAAYIHASTEGQVPALYEDSATVDAIETEMRQMLGTKNTI